MIERLGLQKIKTDRGSRTEIRLHLQVNKQQQQQQQASTATTLPIGIYH